MKIRHKLVLAFGVLILILIAEIILNQVVTNRANQTYDTLQSEINPAITILNHYETINRELDILISSRVKGDNKFSTTNRIKGIVEVELSYIETELSKLKEKLSNNDPNGLILETLITNTQDLKNTTVRFKSLLNKENTESVETASSLYSGEFSTLHSTIDKRIALLILNYNRAYETFSNDLAHNLKSVSKIILFTGIFGIIQALIITFQITYSISRPIYKLKKAALKMSRGN